MTHKRFEWHTDKAAVNRAKHLVRFEDAAAVLRYQFADLFHIEGFDYRHSSEDEDRWRTLGSYPYDRRARHCLGFTGRRIESACYAHYQRSACNAGGKAKL